MAVNISFQGYIRDEVNAPISGAYYQAWFRRVNGGSSPSTWNTVKTADPNGYFSFNLGDGDFLTQDGNAAAGDQVLIAVWTGADGNRLSLTKVLFSFFVTTLTSGTIYTGDVIALSDKVPVTAFSVPSPVRILTNITATNNSSDDHIVSGTRQQRYYAGEEIFNQARVDYCEWSINAVPQTNILNGNNQVFQLPFGDNTVEFTAWDIAGQQGNLDSHIVRALYRVVATGLSWVPLNPTIIQQTDFTPNISDPDNRVTTVDYWIDGVPHLTGVTRDTAWSYTFIGTSQNHTVRQIVNWNDGFADQQVQQDFTIVMTDIGPTSGFTYQSQDITASQYEFTTTATDPDGTIANYRWIIAHHLGATIYDQQGPTLTTISFSFDTEGDYDVTHIVTDDDGSTNSLTQTITVTIVPAGGGGRKDRLVNQFGGF